VVAALRPAARDLVPTAASADRLTAGALSGQSLTNLMEFVKGWSMATSDYDAISHYFKAIVPLSPSALDDTAAGLLPGVPDNILGDLPLPSAPELPLPGRDPRPANSATGPGTNSGADSATGLSQPQETALLEQLLGGLL
jgi:phospholipid/cholesterol/gamma-HCH transport system substrate-binding protein